MVFQEIPKLAARGRGGVWAVGRLGGRAVGRAAGRLGGGAAGRLGGSAVEGGAFGRSQADLV